MPAAGTGLSRLPVAHRLPRLEPGAVESLPRRAEKAPRPERFALAFLLRRPDGAVLFRRRPEKGLLAGMIELPTTPLLPSAAEAATAAPSHAPIPADWHPLDGTIRHVFTHLALTVGILEASTAEMPDGLRAEPHRFPDLAFPP